MSGCGVEGDGVSRPFGRTVALDDVSYRAFDGQVYGLVGVNGVGKTTLIKHVPGLLRATSGTVRVFGPRGPCPEYACASIRGVEAVAQTGVTFAWTAAVA